MKKILAVVFIWGFTLITYWGLFFFCKDKGQGYTDMGILTAVIVTLVDMFITVYLTHKRTGVRNEN